MMTRFIWLTWAVIVFGFMVTTGCSDGSSSPVDGDVTDQDVIDTADGDDIEQVEDIEDTEVDKDVVEGDVEQDAEPDGDIETDGDQVDNDVDGDVEEAPEGDAEEAAEDDAEEQAEDDIETDTEESVAVTVVPFTALTSGGASLESDNYRLQLFVAPVQPVGDTAGSQFKLKLGPAAVVGRGIQE